jgi:hypothetical protein
MKTPNMSVEEIRKIFYFDSSGTLFYKKDSGIWGRVKAGTIAGGKTHQGYLDVRLKQRCFRVHHIIWALHHGKWPEKMMDHINGNRSDNRIENLREVSDRINAENKHIHQRNNKNGHLGVFYRSSRKRFVATIVVTGKKHWLGSFKTAPEAHAAYITAKRLLHEGCSI